MRVITGRRVCLGLVSLFVGATIFFLILIAVMILFEPNFPLSIGLVRTVGLPGLFLTALPAAVGGVGLVQLWRGRRVGSLLLAAYCLFWGAVTLAALPQVWNARQSFCLKGLNFCVTSPWVGRLIVFAIAAPFLLSAWWALRQANVRTDSSGLAQ